jgi:hypothetical protein
MPRPIPTYLRGGKRADAPSAARATSRLVLTCPRVCPKWEFDAWRALIKPQFKTAIAHRSSEQTWPVGADVIVQDIISAADDAVSARVETDGGDEHHLRISFPAKESRAARAFAAELSRRLPELWFTFDRLLLKGGVFYRYRRSTRPEIVPVKTSPLRYKRLPRDIYLAIHGRTEND